MSKSRSKRAQAQVRIVEEQLRLPLVDALVGIRADFLEIVHTAGLRVVEAMLEEDRTAMCGPKHARQPGRTAVRGGTTPGELVLGGRKVAVRRPRAHRAGKGGGELALPTYEALSRTDPLSERAMEQMLVGVSTRKYARSLEPLPTAVESRSTSRSSVSRRFVARTEAELKAWMKRPLGDLDIVALMVDGIGFGEHTLVVALGIDSSGTKHPLAMREGTTENAALCRGLLADLVDRGVPADRTLLVVIDGGKGLRKAVTEVFGRYALVQRCQAHKRRNVLDHLPEHARPNAKAVLDQAYNAESSEVAKKQLERLAKSLEVKHPSAAESLREGLDETLTVLDLGVGPSLRRALATTNPIESMFATVRRVSQRVTRWPTGMMAMRWALAGITEAQKKFRRLMGSSRDMPKLVTALRSRDRDRTATRAAAKVANA